MRLEGRGELARVERDGAAVQEPSRGSFGLVVSDEVTLFDEVLTLLPVVRLDVPEGVSPVVVPKLGVAVRPVEALTLRANVGRAFRLPSFEELYYDAGAVQGNPDLSPEDALSLDAGVEVDFGMFRASATYFRLAIDNLIVFLPETAYLVRASDSKEALSQGVEAAVAASPIPELTLSARYTFTDARFADTGQRLPARSPHQVGGRVAWRVWRIAGWVDTAWQDAMPLDRFGQLEEEERVLLGAGLEGTVTDWLTVQVEGRNLLDKRDAVDALQQPLPGASVFGCAKVEL
jgi:outer membrane cobalamin receptor